MQYRDEIFLSLPSAARRSSVVSRNARKSAFLLALNSSAGPFMTFCVEFQKNSRSLHNSAQLIKIQLNNKITAEQALLLSVVKSVLKKS